jgi:hypothetical protein
MVDIWLFKKPGPWISSSAGRQFEGAGEFSKLNMGIALFLFL